MKRLLVLPFLAISVLFIHTLNAKSAAPGVTTDICMDIAEVLKEAIEEDLITHEAAYGMMDRCLYGLPTE